MKLRAFISRRTGALVSAMTVGFVIGLLLQAFPACSGPPLEPWHLAELDEEFTAEKADEVRQVLSR